MVAMASLGAHATDVRRLVLRADKTRAQQDNEATTILSYVVFAARETLTRERKLNLSEQRKEHRSNIDKRTCIYSSLYDAAKKNSTRQNRTNDNI